MSNTEISYIKMSNKINIGVVGVGKLGTYHMQKLLNHKNVNFIGICDSNKNLLLNRKQEYNVNIFNQIDDLIAECDAITVATPTVEHFNVSKYALEKGLHVFIEKPITATLKDAIRIDSIAKSNNRIVQVGHIERFNNAFIEGLKYLDNPQFIEIHRISPFPNRSLDIPVVMDIMIHDLDILLSITKDNSIKKIDATGASVVTNFIDLANARIEFESGLVANLTASRISVKQMRKIRVFQKKSYIGIDLLDKKIDFFKIVNDKNQPIDSKSMQFDNTDALEDELNHFVNCIRDNREPLVSAPDGIAALKLGLEIEELINQKRE